MAEVQRVSAWLALVPQLGIPRLTGLLIADGGQFNQHGGLGKTAARIGFSDCRAVARVGVAIFKICKFADHGGDASRFIQLNYKIFSCQRTNISIV